MSPPRRRSSRLRGSSGTPGKQSISYASNRLASLTERDETPISGPQPNLDDIFSSPIAPRTPATAAQLKPSLEEMHPSKAHHSTTKEPDSGLQLGFTDINSKGNDQPSGLHQRTPSKIGISSPTFDFRFARPGPQLGPDAQRIMDGLREESLRIKVKLAAEREEQTRKACETAIEGRKIVQPKGKVGRFSDVHMADFKKMESIAGHPSAFRAQPGRFAPATSNLKRTQSNAKLGDREEQSAKKSNDTERLENTAPAKRARQTVSDDTSSARPVSWSGTAVPSTPTHPRSQPTLPASITTPTQASLARAASGKTSGSQIPIQSKSPTKPNLGGTPRGLTKSATTSSLSSFPKSEPRSFLRSPGKLDRFKSILRHPSASMKKPSAMPPSIPSSARSPTKANLEKALPSVPTTPMGLDHSKSVKHVNFTPDVVNKAIDGLQNSPSHMKSGIPRSASKINLVAKSSASGPRTEKNKIHYPSIAGLPNVGKQSQDVEYPSLAGVRPLKEPRQEKSHPPPSVPGTFTFRSDHTISFGASPDGFGSSSGQASVRQVRQSIFPKTIPGSFPGSNKENNTPLPAVPHGMSSKKRRRVESDDETEEEVERSPKKQRALAPKLMEEKMTPNSRLPSPAKKKGVLSMSRLNMLARPKMRK